MRGYCRKLTGVERLPRRSLDGSAPTPILLFSLSEGTCIALRGFHEVYAFLRPFLPRPPRETDALEFPHTQVYNGVAGEGGTSNARKLEVDVQGQDYEENED